ncbi:MAG TPA: hypothetical protein VJ348_02730 [Candidatus Humimicrobiaceae bacterium]|nr:hypothetical protein [Candidatus Humimicrobiaceae bacterium]
MTERKFTAQKEYIENTIKAYTDVKANPKADEVFNICYVCPIKKEGRCPDNHASIPNCRACKDSENTFDYFEEKISEKLPHIRIKHQELKMERSTSRGRLIKTNIRGSLQLTQGGPGGTMMALIKPLNFLKV